MAVAVKTSPGARSAGSLASPAILSLVGVVYLLACLAIVFKLVPSLWWPAWESIGWGKSQFVGGSLMALVAVACGIALLIVGGRLLGPNAPVGVRAGVFVGFSGLLLAVLLARWASTWIEHWAYNGRLFTESTGLIAVYTVAALLVVGWLRLFTRPWMQKFLVALEHGGWFHAIPYKSNQGQKVRRGTVAGILVIVGAGIYTLLSHGTLRRTTPDWALNVPFSAQVAVEGYGDMLGFLKDLPADKTQVEIRWSGDAANLKPGKLVGFETYKAAVEAVIGKEGKLADALARDTGEQKSPAAYVLAVNKGLIGARMQQALADGTYREGQARQLEGQFDQTSWEDIGNIMAAFVQAAGGGNTGTEKLGTEFRIPSGVLVIDRYVVREINDKIDDLGEESNPNSEQKYVKVSLQGDGKFTEGTLVTRADFEKEKDRVEALKKKGDLGYKLPEAKVLAPITGKTQYDRVTLLPSVQFTVPLLLLAGSLWLAWRIVNVPTFADFLIATEAELNKVSWTTQKKLVQDTIVVLVTVLLMSVFLFGMDWTWKVLLSWKPVGVLHIPKEQSQQNKSLEQKSW